MVSVSNCIDGLGGLVARSVSFQARDFGAHRGRTASFGVELGRVKSSEDRGETRRLATGDEEAFHWRQSWSSGAGLRV